MERVVDLWSPAIGATGTVIVYGHWGRPVLVFPSENGKAGDFASNGMVDAVADLVQAGRVKLYCVGSYDGHSWSNRSIPLEDAPAGTAPTSRGSSTRSSPSSTRTAAVRSTCSPPVPAWARSTRRTSPCAAAISFPGRCACPATTTRAPGTAGASRATRCTSRTRWPTSPTCTATTWSGCAAGCVSCSSAARACGRTPPAP